MTSIAESVADILEIRGAGLFPLMTAVERGLPLSALDRVIHLVAPTDTSFVFNIVPRATLARRRKALAANNREKGRLSAEESTRLARLTEVWAMALDVWGGEKGARRFMFEEHQLLHGRRPIDVVLENEFGRPIVEGILGRLKYGTAL